MAPETTLEDDRALVTAKRACPAPERTFLGGDADPGAVSPAGCNGRSMTFLPEERVRRGNPGPPGAF